MNEIAIHNEFVPNRCDHTMKPQPAVTVGGKSIHDFTLGGLVPPLQITPTDHEGGGWVQVFAVHDGHFVKQTEWFRAYRDVVDNVVKTAE